MTRPTEATTAIRQALRTLGPSTREQIRAALPDMAPAAVNATLDGMRKNRQVRKQKDPVPSVFADGSTRLCHVYALVAGR